MGPAEGGMSSWWSWVPPGGCAQAGLGSALEAESRSPDGWLAVVKQNRLRISDLHAAAGSESGHRPPSSVMGRV